MGRRAVARRRSRGATLVEAALVLPFLLTMVFGIIELGLLFDTATVTSSATRGGARIASANFAAAPAADRASVLETVRLTVEESLGGIRGNVRPLELWIYEADADGRPTSSGGFASCPGSCVRYTWDGTRFASATGSWTDPVACGSTFDRIGVYVRVEHRFLTPLLGASKEVDEHTVMRFEPRSDC